MAQFYESDLLGINKPCETSRFSVGIPVESCQTGHDPMFERSPGLQFITCDPAHPYFRLAGHPPGIALRQGIFLIVICRGLPRR
jgi:hypothetical protein